MSEPTAGGPRAIVSSLSTAVREAGVVRAARGFRTVAFDLPPRCAAAYFPEANPLVPLGSIADGSRTPTYKSVVITLAPAAP